MRLSVITPTFGRHEYLRRIHGYYRAQSHADREWLVLDDSPSPCPFLSTLDDPDVVYRHLPYRLSLGEKRNRLVQMATGDAIVHFDDDDYYAPHYLETMSRQLLQYDFVKLSAWYVYSERHKLWGYCNPAADSSTCYWLKASGELVLLPDFTPDTSMFWGYGFSYAYSKDIWTAFPFEPVTFGEDHRLVLEHLLHSRFKLGFFQDTEGLAVHVLHGGCTSDAFVQNHLSPEDVPAGLLAAVRAMSPVSALQPVAPPPLLDIP